MKKLHLIGNAHIDPVWLWRWQDGYSEVLASWRSALDRMKEYDDFTYTSACAVYYQWVEKTDPEMFAEIQQRVKEGRWNIVGGWFLQPDCNLPCGESFARHTLIAQRYFKEKFGVTARTGYNVDSFGHNASLPKILRAGGMDRYVFMRPSKTEKTLDSDLFTWESDDGSRVSTYRIPTDYNVIAEKQDQIDGLVDAIRKDGLPRMLFVGIGNHGGGPSSELVRYLKELNLPDGGFSTPDTYFDQVETQKVPTIREELQHHARGCYSTVTYIKEMNRKCEANLLAAERLCLLAQNLTDYKYPQKALRKGWKNILFNQFHDILAGCSIESSFRDASYLYGETMSITEQAINEAVQAICRKIDTGAASETAIKIPHEGRLVWENEAIGTPIVVFNPHPFPVKEMILRRINASRITDEQYREIPFQYVRWEQTNGEKMDNYAVVFEADVPALGYRVYRAFLTKEQIASFPSLSVTEHRLENRSLCVEFDPATGEIRKITDKISDKVLAQGGMEAILTDETECDTWAHNQFDLGEICGTFGNPEFRILEQGPVCATLRVTTRCGSSTLIRDYTLTADSDKIAVATTVDFHEKHKALKFTFPASKSVQCEIPFGTITRNLNNGEDPFGKWFRSEGLCIANDGKYGYDSTDSQIRMTVLRGAIFADHYGVRDDRCRYMDQGEHRFTYEIFPFRTVVDAQRRAEVLNMPLRAVNETFHRGPLPLTYRGFSSDAENLLVSAIKKSEDGTESILRVYEAEGKDTTATLELMGRKISASVPAFAIRTVDESGTPMNFMEWKTEG